MMQSVPVVIITLAHVPEELLGLLVIRALLILLKLILLFTIAKEDPGIVQEAWLILFSVYLD